MSIQATPYRPHTIGYLKREAARLEAEIDELLAFAGRTNAKQHAALRSRRGDELPEDRLAKIQAAKAH